MTRRVLVRTAIMCAALALPATALVRAQQPPPQQPAAPTGPLAPEKYKDIQVLKDVPADQLDTLMRYFVASTGLQCQTCHVRDQATGQFAYEKDTRSKTTAREMIRLVQTVNAGGQEQFGARINCATCHQGRNQPAGLQAAIMMTPEQIAAAAAQAARQGGAGGPGGAAGLGQAGPGRGAPPPGGAAGQAGAGGQAGQGGGRGNQVPAPPIDDVLNKYIDALGGRAALEKLQSRVITGSYVNRANQTVAFTIEEKGSKYRETTQLPAGPMSVGFDGQAGWIQTGTTVADLVGFPLAQATRLNDLTRALQFKDLYQNLQAGRPTRLPAATPGGTPIDVNLIQGVPAPNVTERFYFDVTTGLLLRRQVITRAPLNGSMSEIFEYSDYRPVNGVMMPFTIKRNNWNTLDMLTITDVKANAKIDDARFSKPKG